MDGDGLPVRLSRLDWKVGEIGATGFTTQGR